VLVSSIGATSIGFLIFYFLNRNEVRVGQRERFLTAILDSCVLTVEATENDELYHELSARKFTFHESDKPVVSPCLF